MNIKKLVAIPDQVRNCASPRKKIVSGFGLGFVSFFIVLFVLFFNFSFKNPTSNKLFFQGFNIGDNSSLIAWSFSFTTTSSLNSSHATQVEQNPKIFESDGADMDISLNFLGSDGNEDTHLGNLTGVVKNGSFNGISDKILDFEDTHLKNGVKNGSFSAIAKNPNQENGNGSVESVGFDSKIDLKNEKDDNGVKNGSFGAITMNPNQENVVKHGSFNGISDKVLDFEDTHLMNGVKNGSFSAITKNPNQENGVKNGSFNGISDEVLDFVDTHLKNGVKNGSFSAVTKNPNQKNGNGSVESIGFDSKIDLMNKKDGNGDGVLTKSGVSEGDHGLITQFKSNNYNKSFKECDIFDGRWVKDETKPYYPAGSCPYVDRDFNCHLNKRPDDEFLKWKWQPFGCEIPSLNATNFLERLRGKKLVFVGDSLNRNMWESLVCILQNSLENKKRVYEISGRREFKKKGFYAFRFEDYNCTVDFVSSPFLVLESSFKGKNGSFETLRLDLMDRTTSMYHDADILVFNTGHWWTHEKTSRGEDYYQEGKHVYPRLKVLDAYTRALSTWARWVDKNIDVRKTQVIFRGYSVTHFRGGQWNSGGQCHKETEPIFNTSHLTKYPSKMRAFDNVARTMKTPLIYLNISRLTDYRKDGHPSIYRMMYKSLKHEIAGEQSQDCSHWCLPGVPDTWNELLYASLLKVGKGSWKN